MRAEQYRASAFECLRFASGLLTAEAKTGLLDIAMAWLKLADQAEKNEKAVLLDEAPAPRLRVVR
jgi:hypothetical protein